MATIDNSGLGSILAEMMDADDIQPGDQPSYQLCKEIYIYHPIGAKLVDSPIAIAQSQKREISVPKGPEARLIEAFLTEWEAVHADRYIANTARLARIYGISSLAVVIEGEDSDKPLDYNKLYKQDISFSCFDPLNTAGSLVLNQDPNSIDFQKVTGIRVSGNEYHRSRFLTIQNEDPIYIAYNVSSFGFNGRSVYQRALYPLKSFIQTMLTDNLIAYKAGVIVAKIQQPGSIIDRAMSYIAGVKRAFIKVATVGNVISISPNEEIETLNFQNLHNPFGMARKNIIDNIASAAGLPALLINQEPFVEGFGEGTEDAKQVAQAINNFRIWMHPLYAFFDKIVQHRAWNEDFYAGIQRDFPKEYGKKPYTVAFSEWVNSFTTIWPNLIQEPPSDKVMVEDVKLKAIIALVEVTAAMMPPECRSKLLQDAFDNINAMKEMFSTPFDLDWEAIADYVPPAEQQALAGPKEPGAPAPFSAHDSSHAIDASNRAVANLAQYLNKKRLDARKPTPRLTYIDE